MRMIATESAMRFGGLGVVSRLRTGSQVHTTTDAIELAEEDLGLGRYALRYLLRGLDSAGVMQIHDPIELPPLSESEASSFRHICDRRTSYGSALHKAVEEETHHQASVAIRRHRAIERKVGQSTALVGSRECEYFRDAGIRYICASNDVPVTSESPTIRWPLKWTLWNGFISIDGLLNITFAIVFSGSFVGFLALYGEQLIAATMSAIPVVGVAMILVAGGIALYCFRCRGRRVYGCIECAAGVAITYTTIASATDITTAQLYLRVLAGLYIIVRGLDNIGKSFRGTPHERWWSKVFGSDY